LNNALSINYLGRFVLC